jgi:hypothetical protein
LRPGLRRQTEWEARHRDSVQQLEVLTTQALQENEARHRAGGSCWLPGWRGSWLALGHGPGRLFPPVRRTRVCCVVVRLWRRLQSCGKP